MIRPLTDEEKRLDAICEPWLSFDKEKGEFVINADAPKEALDAFEKSKELYRKYQIFEY